MNLEVNIKETSGLVIEKNRDLAQPPLPTSNPMMYCSLMKYTALAT